MAYRLLGSGTTDSNGRATHTYTGVGAGELDVVASLDNPIVSGSVQSEPYQLLDAMFYDTGISGTANSDYIPGGTGSYEVQSDGTLLSTTNNGYFRFANKPNTSSDAFDWTGDYIVEFDLVTLGGDRCGLQIYNGTPAETVNLYFTNYDGTDGSHVIVKMVNDDTVRGIYVDGTTRKSSFRNLCSSNSRVGLFVASNSQTMKFKDFKIYPI